MANVQQKNGVFHVRFRFGGRQYKKSLKTKNRRDAQDACTLVEATIHKILTVQVKIPAGVDAGDFIVSDGTLTVPPPEQPQKPLLPSLQTATEACLESRRGKSRRATARRCGPTSGTCEGPVWPG